MNAEKTCPGSPLWEAIFTYYGGARTRSDDRVRLDLFLRNLSEGKASLNWDLKVFDIRDTFLTGPYRPWRAIVEIEQLRAAGHKVPHSLFEAVCSTWALLKFDLRRKLHSGHLIMVGRPSPRDAFEVIARDAWPHYELEDWETGRASSAYGDRIFSVHIGLASEITLDNADQSPSPSLTIRRAISPHHRKSAPKANAVFQALAALFPDPYKTTYMTVKELNKLIRQWLASNDIPELSDQTIKRALKEYKAAASETGKTPSDK